MNSINSASSGVDIFQAQSQMFYNALSLLRDVQISENIRAQAEEVISQQLFFYQTLSRAVLKNFAASFEKAN